MTQIFKACQRGADEYPLPAKEFALLINKEWQPLPGTHAAEIYPYLRKPDLLSSNSCVIRTPQQIILIDAGALPAQTHELCGIIRKCYQEQPRPVLLYLTHCHIDHTLSINNFRQMLEPGSVWIAIQEEGARYLTRGDSRKTIAELYGIDCPSSRPDIHLLTGQDHVDGSIRCIDLPSDVPLTLKTEIIPTREDQSLLCQKISMGSGDYMEFYPIPGHSPDSVCIRIGGILFIGDLLAAANPMVAGISGWNRDDLIQTLRQVLWLLDNRPVAFCYPGHGGILPADKIRGILRQLQEKTRRLGDMMEMNEDRLFKITDFALELIDEAEEVFSSIAGRLLYVAYQLEKLEEEEAADRCRSIMPMDEIDACLTDFRHLCFELDGGKIRRVEFAHSVLHVVQKVKSLFDPRPLAAVLPQTLINRGTRLLLDFIGIANGSRNLEEFIPTDLNALIGDMVQQWKHPPQLDNSIIDYADDYDKYLAGLTSRIGYGPVGKQPVLSFEAPDNLPLVRIAAARLTDTLLNFLEWLKQSDPQSIRIAAGMGERSPFIEILPKGPDGSFPIPDHEKKLNAFQRRFRICGLILKPDNEGFRLNIAEHESEE
jgi:glyoxylase-like metal-dependent hydrolase (beta-lactamase superfamily II)